VVSFFLRRILQLIPVLWGVGTIVFLLIHLVPGDPVDIMLGENALPASREELRANLGLDRPLPHQYVQFWKSLAMGDLGRSFISRRPVGELIKERLPATLLLALSALSLSVLLALPFGLLAAVFRNRWPDHILLLISILAVAVPSFWLAPLLMIFFSIELGWLPVSEFTGWRSLVLPSVTLGIGMCAVTMRMTRASLDEVLDRDYIRTARAKGLSEWSVFTKHSLKNALIPVITVIGLQLGGLLAGTVITETIFDWPGIGELLFRAIQSRDFPLVQGCVLTIACGYVFASTLADMAYRWANPKVEAL
jgi:ABC-type dipeptide/oligopeptide/nickel transport system permease component